MGEKKSKAESIDGEELISGVIEYSILTKTPLFIPNTSFDHFYGKMEKSGEHKSYAFSSYVDYSKVENRTNIPDPEPVIPGSEIRGMFRSNYEILTNSCMSALDSDMLLSKRTMETYQAGLLRRETVDGGKNCYDLYQAIDVLWRTKGANSQKDDLNWVNDTEHRNRRCYIQKDFPEGSCVEFKMHKRKKNGRAIKPLASEVKLCQNETQNTEGYTKGYIIKGEKSPGGRSKKHCCHIFSPITNGGSPVRKDIKISLLDDLLDIYASNKLEPDKYYKEYRAGFEEFKKGNGSEYFPVYYCRLGDKFEKKVFLAPACKTREIYDNTLEKLAGELAPCTGESGFCAACELFGTVTPEGEGKSSKIRFTDLTVKKRKNNRDYYLDRVTLPELSSPKLNNMEFYVERPLDGQGNGAQFWTYDYYIDANGDLHVEQGRLAGRKFYWHQNLKDENIVTEKPNRRNVTIRPIQTGNIFSGKMYFDKITKATLDQLAYLINTGEEVQDLMKKKYGYKIGMAKPLGFGSIACKVDKIEIKSYRIEEDTIQRKRDPYYAGDFSEIEEMFKRQSGSSIIENFHKMTGFDSIELKSDEHFSYPKLSKESKGYEWYAKNHVGTKNGMPNSRKEMRFKEYLTAMEPRVKRTGDGGE